MRIRLLSDLHLEFQPFTLKPVPGVDVTILAGDIANQGVQPQARLEQLLGSIDGPVIYVPGNHEYDFSNEPVDRVHDALREMIQRVNPRVSFLDRGTVELGGIRFLGCTLWTGYEMLERSAYLGRPITQGRAMAVAAAEFSDFRQIIVSRHPFQRLTPEIQQGWYARDRMWLTGELHRAEQDKIPAVVVTHFLPLPGCVNPRYEGSVLNPYFANNLAGLFKPPLRLWLHGHTHCSVGFAQAGIPVLCNPRGCTYLRLKKPENHDFTSTLVVEV